jgi:hypothetical protein
MALLVCGQFVADLALGRRAGATAASDVGLGIPRLSAPVSFLCACQNSGAAPTWARLFMLDRTALLR